MHQPIFQINTNNWLLFVPKPSARHFKIKIQFHITKSSKSKSFIDFFVWNSPFAISFAHSIKQNRTSNTNSMLHYQSISISDNDFSIMILKQSRFISFEPSIKFKNTSRFNFYNVSSISINPLYSSKFTNHESRIIFNFGISIFDFSFICSWSVSLEKKLDQ